MPDYSLAPCVTLVFGRSGSGKTTFAFLYLLNRAVEQDANDSPAAGIFIFDWKLEASARLGLPVCGTLAQCEAAVPTRWVVFNPAVMFQERQEDALRWFCQWVFDVSQRGLGKKIIYVDELWRFVSPQSLPVELQRLVRMGRAENLELISSSQRPRDFHADIRSQATEWIGFNVNRGDAEPLAADWPGVERICDLPAGSFLAVNREGGAELAGRVF